MKKLIAITALLMAAMLYGCKEYTPPQPPPETPNTTQPETPPEPDLEEVVNETINIASFNIQIFGRSKRSKDDVMAVLTNISRNFDIIAVQEFRDSSETTLDYFVQKINEMPGPVYASVGSARLGRTTSKESYAFVYNTETVTFSGTSYVYNDTNDIFEREPFIAGFSSGNFDYILVNIHAKPDDAESEIQALVDVIADADNYFPDDHDVIVLGDYNADGSYFSETTTTGLRGTDYTWVIGDDLDTTVATSSNTYDRIVFQADHTTEDFAGEVGVMLFESLLPGGLEAKKVSDHYPVWAVFYTNRDTD